MKLRQPKSIYKNLAKRIRERRGILDLSQEQLALMAGIDRTYISKIERCIANPSLNTLIRISEILEIPLQNLLSTNPEEE